MEDYSEFFKSVDAEMQKPDTYVDFSLPPKPKATAPQTDVAPAADDRSILKDAAGLWGVGSGSLVQGLGWLFNSDEMTELGQNTSEYWQNTLSETQKAANEKRFVNDDWSLGDGATDLNTIFGTVVQSLPHMVPGVGAAGLAAKGATVAGATPRLASLLAAGAGSAGEGVTIGAMVGSEVDQTIRGLSEDDKMQSPYYADLRKLYDEDEATNRLSKMAANPAALKSGTAGAALGIVFNKFLGDALTRRLSGGPVKEGVKGGLIEGGTEVLQSGAEAHSTQSALNEYAAQPMSYTDMVNQMVGGLAAGTTMGVGVGVAGGLSGQGRPDEPEPSPAPTERVRQARARAEQAGADALDATRAGAEELLNQVSQRPDPAAFDQPEDIGGLLKQATEARRTELLQQADSRAPDPAFDQPQDVSALVDEARNRKIDIAATATDLRPRPETRPELTEAVDADPRPETVQATEDAPTESGTGVFRVPVDQIKVDPEQYQFRSRVNEQGVDKRLEGVEQWDDDFAGFVLLHRRADGSLYVADGHHRVDLAKKLNQSAINARVVDEADGVTVAKARQRAAMANIADSNAEPLDVAKVFRDSEVPLAEVRKKHNLPNNQVSRDGEAIARLSDNVFGMVVAGQLNDKDGAAIGAAFSEPGQQEAAAGAFQKVEPTTDYQRQLLVNEIRAAEFAEAQGDQGGLFGDDPQEISLMQDRLKVLDSLRQQLNSDKRLFKSLNDNAGRAGDAGNVIATEANESITQQSARSLDLIARVTTTPELNAMVNRAARRVFDGEPRLTVARELKKELQSYEAGRTGRSDGRPADAPSRRAPIETGQESGRNQPVPEADPVGADQAGQSESEVTPTLDLETQTEEQLAEQAAARDAAEKAEAEQRKQAEQKEKADAEADDFVLSGSNSAVDQAEARGQGNMFDTEQATEDSRGVKARRSSYRASPNQQDLFADPQELEALKNVDPYENAETRPGTTEAQRDAGRSALRDLLRQLNARYRRTGRTTEAGGGISLLGAAMYKNFKAGKPNQLIGQTVRTPQDLAALAQVYRDPRFETFRLVLTKNGKVVTEQAVTSRLPSTVRFHDDYIDDLRSAMKATGADGYYMMHNHPSGKSEPSSADLRATLRTVDEVPGFLSHVVIDHNEFSTIDKYANVELTKDESLGSTDFWSDPDQPNDLLGFKIRGGSDVAELAKKLQNDQDRVVFIGADAKNKVTLLTSLPANLMMELSSKGSNRAEAIATLRRLKRASGSGGYAFLAVNDKIDVRTFAPLINDGIVMDVVDPDGNSGQMVGDLKRYPGDVIETNIRGMRIADEVDGYQSQTDSPAFRKWFGSSKVVDENGEPLVVYHGTGADFTEFRLSESGSVGPGIYFTKDPEKAGVFAESAASDDIDLDTFEVVETDKSANIIPAYLSVQNPAKASDMPLGREAESAKEQGYDGLFFDDYIVVFEPNQIKSATGNSGTFDPDTPDIRFSRTGPRNLFVAHNLSESNLEHVLELGGLAAPSLAVGRTDRGFDDFGEITLLAPSSIIESDKARTFDADVYTPRHPRAEYKIDRDAYLRQRDSLDNDLGLDHPDISDLERDGMEGMARSYAYQYAWLKSQNKAPKPKLKKVDPVIRQLAKLDLNRYELRNDPKALRLAKKYFQDEQKKFEEVVGRDEARQEKLYFDSDGNVDPGAMHNLALRVEQYQNSGGYDTAQMKHDLLKKMRPKLVQRQYERWIKDRFNEVTEASRMFDGFTPSGNRRYKPYDLENVVKVMTRKLQGGEGFNYGAGSVRSAYAKEFKRVSQVQANRDKIVSPEEMERIKEESNDRLMEVLSDLKPYYRFDAGSWGYTDDASSAIAEGPKGWREAFDLDAEGRALIAEFTDYLKTLPTAYFETKVGRAVDLSEFAVAIVPKGTSKEAVQALRDKGLKVKRYDPADPDSRRQEITKQEDLLFSRDGEFRRTRTQASPNLTAAQAESITDTLMADWKGSPKVVIADRISEFPKRLRDAIRAAQAEGDMRGVYFEGKVYILASRIPSRAALEEVVLHEVVGHYGLRKMLGDDLKPLLNQVYLKFARTDQAKKLIRNYFPNGDFNASNLNHRLTVAEELLAHLAETGKHQKLWTRIVAAVRDGLRKLGFTLDITEADLLGILAGAQKTVEQGGVSLPSEADNHFRRAYHGTPHRFDKFSLEAIGSGEGAQAYGWGLYFAGNRSIAEYYQRVLSSGRGLNVPRARPLSQAPSRQERDAVNKAEQTFNRVLRTYATGKQIRVSWGGNLINLYNYQNEIGDLDAKYYEQNRAEIEQEIESAESAVKKKNPDWSESEVEKAISGMGFYDKRNPFSVAYSEAIKELPAQERGNLYEVEIPDDSDLLDRDAPLSRQSESVKEKLATIDFPLTSPGSYAEEARLGLDPFDPLTINAGTGADLQAAIAKAADQQTFDREGPIWEMVKDDPERLNYNLAQLTSMYLNSIGIPGLRYLDGNSRHRSFKEIRDEFLTELPEDAEIEDVVELFGTGAFSPDNEMLLTALNADDWLGFDYPAQAVSTVLGDSLSNYDPSPGTVDAVARLREEGDRNYVIWDESVVSVQAVNDEIAQAEAMFSRADQTNTEAFRKWFGDSKVVDENGEPLVVYHGTGNLEELTEFKPGLTGRGNDQIGSGFYFTTRRTEASGYATAVTGNVQSGTTKLGGDTSPGVMSAYLSIQNPIEVQGSNLNDIDLELSEDQAFEIIKRAPGVYDLDESPLGDFIDIWSAGEVTDDMLRDAAANYSGTSLISLENDFFSDSAGEFRRAVHDATGHDGVVQTFSDGGKHFVAWFPEQIKSATGNAGTFDPGNADIRFSRTGRDIDQFDDFTDDQRRAFGKIAPLTATENAKEWLAERTDRWQTKLRQGMVDRFAALMELDQARHGKDVIENSTASSSWVLAQMAGSAAGALQSMLTTARIQLDPRQKVITLQEGSDRGLNDVLKQLGNPGEIDRFFGWIAGNRSRKLMAEGRENLFTPEEVEALATANTGTTANGESRTELYDRVFAEFQQYRDDVLQIADAAGLLRKAMTEEEAMLLLAQKYEIAPALVNRYKKAMKAVDRADDEDVRDMAQARAGEIWGTLAEEIEMGVENFDEEFDTLTTDQRDLWANEFYVPFYREVEGDGSPHGPKDTSSISRQKAYDRLKGGEGHLRDLLQNTMLNFHHLLQASLKNQAAIQAMDNAQAMGIAEATTESQRSKDNSTFILRDGKKIWYNVNDPLVFKAVTSLAHPGMNSSAMKVMRSFKRLFTNLTTTTPQFVVANLLRDSMQAGATSEVSKNFLKNIVKGSKAYGDERTRAQMMASGGAFSFGHLYGENADEIKLQLTGGLTKVDVLRSPNMVPAAIQGVWRKWNEATEFTENINRAAIFEANRQEKGDLYAAFKSRDLMNFSQHGAFPAMRVLIDVVPFLNARIQGLDKIYRSGVKPGLAVAMGKGSVSDKQAAARFWSVTGAMALASVALFLHNRDDEEYQKLEEWQKDSYWFFRISDDHAIFIPKPFEVGAIATLVERLTEQAVSDTATGELFAQRLGHMMMDTFSFSPIPQMAQPALDVYANYDAFTGRPIEGMGMERLSPELRRRVNTSAPAVAASKLSGATAGLWGGEGLSPVQMDHLIQGYFGAVGSWAAGVTDTVWKAANGETEPSKFWYENQPIRRFYKNLGDEDRYTRYGTVFYEALKETNRVYADIQEYMKLGEVEQARELYESNKRTLSARVILNRAQRKLSDINKAMQNVRRMKGSSEYKRRELDRLRGMKNAIQRALGQRVEQLNASS